MGATLINLVGFTLKLPLNCILVYPTCILRVSYVYPTCILRVSLYPIGVIEDTFYFDCIPTYPGVSRCIPLLNW